jgi:predicted dehydrogenase
VSAVATKPRLGFVGLGWIGRARMEALARSGVATVAAVADPAVPEALASLDELLEHELDGLVIATPNALHARQALAALERGLAVFCQKPLGRDARETEMVVRAAREADRLLGVDLSYRHTTAARALRDAVPSLGNVFAGHLVFHNAYGPDKAWFYDPKLAGGGCVLDLGIHLVDLALWLLDADVTNLDARVLHHGGNEVEDYAAARLDMTTGATLSLACSWNLPAGRDCVFDVSLYGERGGAAMRNVGGSFYDFSAERFDGTRVETLVEPPDQWGGRALQAWAEQLARDPSFDEEVEHVVRVARVLDAIYGRAT